MLLAMTSDIGSPDYYDWVASDEVRLWGYASCFWLWHFPEVAGGCDIGRPATGRGQRCRRVHMLN